MTNPRSATTAARTGLPTGPADRLVVVLRPVPDTVARALTTAGLTVLAGDDTKVVYAPDPHPDRSPAGDQPAADSPGPKVLYTPVEAAAQLSIGRSTVYELMATGDLESILIGRCRRIPASSITSYVERISSVSRAGGTIDPYRSSGPAQDAAVDRSNTDGRVSMARTAQRRNGGRR